MKPINAVRERPILFSAPMVRAELDDNKTQTRRAVKFPAGTSIESANPQTFEEFLDRFAGIPQDTIDCLVGKPWTGPAVVVSGPDVGYSVIECPYGAVGDRLWVRETWRPICEEGSWNVQVNYAADGASRYLFDGDSDPGDWRMPKTAARGNVPSIFMPRWASRITLEITDVRVERLNEISEDDARAEGAQLMRRNGDGNWSGLNDAKQREGDGYSYRDGFRYIWETIHGLEAWASNPWAWALSFKRVAQAGEA